MPVVFLQFSQAPWILAVTSGLRLSDILMVLPKYFKFSSLAGAPPCYSRLSGPIYIVLFLLIFSPLPSNTLHHSSSWSCSVWQVSAVSVRSSANISVHRVSELASDPSMCITMMKRKGLRTETWWSPTSTGK